MNLKLLNTFKESPVKLIAVSKTRSVEQIKEFYDQGHKDFGENRVQELLSKVDHLPKDISWHLIGHLQKNKIKYIAGFIDWIHSVDSIKLLRKINNEAAKHDRKIKVLFQFKIAQEETKFGFDFKNFMEQAEDIDFGDFANVEFKGVMGMASFVNDETQVTGEFKKLKEIFDTLKSGKFEQYPEFTEISMGMSGDYDLAIEHGSTMVRIGTLLFKRS